MELNFSYNAVASLLKVGVNQAVILMPRSKHYPNSYITGWVSTHTQLYVCVAEVYTCVDHSMLLLTFSLEVLHSVTQSPVRGHVG